ncbi:hypothetical protein ACNAW0_09575 [Micromonospora sp. SL1-18]|uniref:hypothetical protein n=1 Tax=Micromonospora sp. SL1-18 TaxID=3399128 RepID=UPI003A4E2659
MSFRRPDGPADRAESERLLDAASAGQPPWPRDDPLAHLLAAAAAPASPAELPGEEQALVAFRAARANPPAAWARVSWRRRIRVGVAAWAAGLAAVATAGVAVAAVHLERPWVPVPSASTTSGSSGAGGLSSPTQSGAGSPTAGAPGAVPPAAPDPTAAPGLTGTAAPGRSAAAPNVTGQCRAYLAKSDEQRAKALETPGFVDLVTAAGGADQVEDYCIRLVPEAARKSPPSARSTRLPQTPSAAPPAELTGSSQPASALVPDRSPSPAASASTDADNAKQPKAG